MNCAGRSDAFFFFLRVFFLRNGVSKDFFFFPLPEADKGGGKKNYSSSYEGKIEGLSPRRRSSRSPLAGTGPAASRKGPGPARPRPAGRTGRSFGYPCPFELPVPASSRRRQVEPTDPAGALAARAPGRRPPQPGRQQAPGGARPRRGLFIRRAASGPPLRCERRSAAQPRSPRGEGGAGCAVPRPPGVLPERPPGPPPPPAASATGR